MLGTGIVVLMALLFALWFFVVRPGDKAHHERRLELLQKKIRAAEARQRHAAGSGPSQSRAHADVRDDA